MQNEGISSSSTFFCVSDQAPISPPFSDYLSVQNPLDAAGYCVLILGKESETRFLFRTMLEIWGYAIEESESLEDSLAVVSKQKTGLILLDSVPPFEENLEIIRQLRKNKYSKDIPVIVLSGFSQPIFKSLSLAVGADNFFVKPVDFDLLETCLKNKLERYFDADKLTEET